MLKADPDMDRVYKIIITYLRCLRLLYQEYLRLVRYGCRVASSPESEVAGEQKNRDVNRDRDEGILGSAYKLHRYIICVPLQEYQGQGYLDWLANYWRRLRRHKEIRYYSGIWVAVAGKTFPQGR